LTESVDDLWMILLTVGLFGLMTMIARAAERM
jgi:hypothetical protein